MTHYCLSPDYPGGRIVCMCARGQDHDEPLFDVPVGDEPATSEDDRATG